MGEDVLSAGEATDIRSRLRRVEEEASDARAKIDQHEAICALWRKTVDMKFNIIIAIAGLALTVEMFGGREALKAGLKLLGVAF